jgi:hypothetical protein
MNLYDFIIIYLACGAPLGVYYFLQHRKTSDFKHLRLKSLLNFLFWMPFAFRLLRRNAIFTSLYNKVFAGNAASDAEIEKNIRSLQKRLERIYLPSRLKISIYEFREILERYIGLTRSGQIENNFSQTARPESEIFRISGHKNSSLGAICLNRRNRKRLSFHQTEARRDFLALLDELFDSGSDSENLYRAAIEFVTALGDAEALDSIKRIFDLEPQSRHAASVKNAETEKWKAERQPPLITRPDSPRLKALAATMNLRGKD